MHRIVFLDRAILPAPLRAPAFAHTWTEFPATAPHELDERLRDATIVVSSKIALRAATLARFPSIRFIAVAGTGTDAFDLDYCRAHGIAVSNVSGYAKNTVPEHAFMLILALMRNLPAYRSDVAAGLWQRAEPFCLLTHPLSDLHGKTLGIVGEGAIGQGSARIAWLGLVRRDEERTATDRIAVCSQEVELPGSRERDRIADLRACSRYGHHRERDAMGRRSRRATKSRPGVLPRSATTSGGPARPFPPGCCRNRSWLRCRASPGTRPGFVRRLAPSDSGRATRRRP